MIYTIHRYNRGHKLDVIVDRCEIIEQRVFIWFRHLFASLLVNQGVDIVTVSGALGHSAVSTTSNIYCHLLENSRAKVSEAITEALKLSDRKQA